MYADYLKETHGLCTLEMDGGFCTYRVEGVNLYISDFYVKPEMRTARCAKNILDQLEKIARAKFCELMYGHVRMSNLQKERALGLYISWGAFVVGAENGNITVAKEIKA
jgi:ribosomal protein S18 acetylase RimI-like enzyme